MSLQKVEDKAVIPAETVQVIRRKKPVKILDEETYTKGLETIIERDFYPDLLKLKNQSEYFEALEKNDHVKLREIQMKIGGNRPNTGESSVYSTPATFETPEPGRKATSPVHRNRDKSLDTQHGEKLTSDTESEHKVDKILKHVTLDKFLSKNTSEDNASFEEILTETQKKHREKHAWLYENEDSRRKEEEDRLALPNIETQAITQNEQAGVDSWKYQIKNSLMYVPDGCELSASEIIDLKKSKPREIIYENSRFQYNPWNQMKSKEMLAKAASDKAVSNCGKIGHDGKEILPIETPKINGYGFVATPSPAPGVNESPLMTWGEIEGTPFQIEGGATPLVNAGAPAFKIPDIPKRDQIGMELAEKASKAHRDKKEKALKSVQAQARLSTPSSKFGMSTSERISSMSPAAQRLATSRLGIRTHTDKALKASYTPSPSHRLPGDKTPVRITPRRTPKSGSNTPSGGATPGSKRGGGTDITSLTDNLLNLPKRKKASDFF